MSETRAKYGNRKTVRTDPEYQLCKAVSTYLKLQYPGVLFHFDPTGNKLTKAQAGKLKAIQDGSAWPDLFIAKAAHGCHGLMIELKSEGTKLVNSKKLPVSEHVFQQHHCLCILQNEKYQAWFAVGFDQAKRIIDDYLKYPYENI